MLWPDWPDYASYQIAAMEALVRSVVAHGPQDRLTLVAHRTVKVVCLACVALAPVAVITTAIGGALIAMTLGLLAVIIALIWYPFALVLLATSWLWLNLRYLRPLLLVPGVIMAFLATVFLTVTPDPHREQKHAKLCLANEWPFSWHLVNPPAKATELDREALQTPAGADDRV